MAVPSHAPLMLPSCSPRTSPPQLPKDTLPATVPAESIAAAAEALRSPGCTLLDVNAEGTKIKRKQVHVWEGGGGGERGQKEEGARRGEGRRDGIHKLQSAIRCNTALRYIVQHPPCAKIMCSNT